MVLSVTDLIAAVKRRSGVPANQDRLTDADIVALLNEEQQETVYPFINALNSEFFVQTVLVTMRDSSGNPNYPTGVIPLPKRTFARGLRDCQYIDSGNNRYNLPYINPEDIDRFNSQTTAASQAPIGFFFQNDAIKLVGPIASLSGSIEYTFYLEPSTLVDAEIVASVTNVSFDSSASTLTYYANVSSIVGSGFPANAATSLFDLVRVSTGAVIKADLILNQQSIVGTSVYRTFTESSVTADYTLGLQQGGFTGGTSNTGLAAYADSELVLVPAGSCNFSTLPKEADNYLIVVTTGRVLESLGYTEELNVNANVATKVAKHMSSAYGDRISGEVKKVVNRRGIHAYSMLNRRGS